MRSHLRQRLRLPLFGPSEGSVNAPQGLREFTFSPDVGQESGFHASARTAENVATIKAFGRGWLFVESARLTPVRRGERAAFEAMAFCGSPAGTAPPSRLK